MKKMIPIICLMAVIVPGSTTLLASTSAKEVIEKAEAARKEAASLGYEWRDTAALIKSAQAALDSGKEKEASLLAHEALVQGEQATLQGKNMKQNWKQFMPAGQ